MVLELSPYVTGAVGAGVGYGLYKAIYYKGVLSVLRDDGNIKIDEVENWEKAKQTLEALANDVDEADNS